MTKTTSGNDHPIARKPPAQEIDGLVYLPDGAAAALSDMREYLLSYLRLDKQLSDEKICRLLAESLPQTGFRSVSIDLADEGVSLALGMLNSMASIVRVKIRNGGRLDGRPFTTEEAIRWLISGEHGLRDYRHAVRNQEFAKKGAQERIDASRTSQQRWYKIAKPLRKKHPAWSNTRLALEIVKALGVGNVNTIRQWIPSAGLARKS